ncbi:hypothetical protein EZS27_018275 [termite gut metagenome]|uniref:Uncharacterized protein n=1 Tax=termite gut metagenome TaxID=433724 RepID=A0A5J4RI30_9ZZZZ
MRYFSIKGLQLIKLFHSFAPYEVYSLTHQMKM